MVNLFNQRKLDEVVFANRNRSYGAYPLRASYHATVVKSLGIVTGACLLFALPFQVSKNVAETPLIFDGQIIDSAFRIVKIIVPPQIPGNCGEHKRTSGKELSSRTSTLILDSAETVIDSLPSEIPAGEPEVPLYQGPLTFSFSAAGSSTLPVAEDQVSDDPYHIADSNPEFEGGYKALTDFMYTRLKYPEQASRDGKGGKVYLRFVVDEKGRVTKCEALSRIGYGFEEEALRVARMIPDFIKPGMVKGKPVKVYFSMPVKFTLR